MRKVLLMPVAFDLAHDTHDSVIVGPGTRRACDEAIRAARELDEEQPLILTTAARAGPAYGRQEMGRIMLRYLEEAAPDVETVWYNTVFFGTTFEICALTEYVMEHPEIDRVIVTVKSWHAPRVRLLMRRIFKENTRRPYEVRPHAFPVGPATLLREVVAYAATFLGLK